MLLTELTTVSQSALPVQAMKNHLRLGSGFTDDGLQDGLVESYLRSALAAVEGRIGKVLISRQFRLRIEDWRSLDEQALPVAPVTAITSVTLVDAAGGSQVVDAGRYRLVPDAHRPRLAANGMLLPTVPTGGHIEIVFDAGFGAAWTQVPPDLAQAVMMLTARYYEQRNENGQLTAGLPFAVQTLIERWRTVRVLGGGTA